MQESVRTPLDYTPRFDIGTLLRLGTCIMASGRPYLCFDLVFACLLQNMVKLGAHLVVDIPSGS